MKPTELKFPTDPAGRVVGILFLLLIPLVTLVPYAAIPLSLTQDLALRWVSAAVFLICLAAHLPPLPGLRTFKLDFPNILLLLLCAWVLLSAKNSKESFESFYAFRGFLALILWWFSLRAIWQRWPGVFPAFEKSFLWTAYLAAAWICLYMAGREAGIPIFKAFIERKGMFLNENIGAGFLGMALLWGVVRRLHGQAASAWGLALLFLAWALTESRGAFVAMMAVVLLYLLLHMKEVEQRLSKWDTRQWVIFAATVVGVLVCSSYTVKKFFDALEVDPRAFNRWELWKSSIAMALSQPLLGFGPGTFADVFPDYQPAEFWNTYVPAAHNEYLQTMTECGWPALLLTLLFLWCVLRETGAYLRTPAFREAAREEWIPEFTFYLVLLEALHNVVDFTFHEWCHRLVLLAFVTYALTRRKKAEDVEASVNLSARALLAGVAVLALFVSWTLGRGAYRDYMAKLCNFNASSLYDQNNLDLAEAFGERSLSYRSDYMQPWNLLGAIEDVRGERTARRLEKQRYFEMAEQDYQKAAQLSPYALTPLENQVRLMKVQGRLDDALDLQKKLVGMAPEYPPAYIEEGGLLLRMGRVQDAIAAAQMAIDLDYYFIPGQLLKANAMEALGKKDDAIQVYKAIADILHQVNNPEYDDRLKQIEGHIRKLQGRLS